MILRHHKSAPGGRWCCDGRRFEAMSDMELAQAVIFGEAIPAEAMPSPAMIEYARGQLGAKGRLRADARSFAQEAARLDDAGFTARTLSALGAGATRSNPTGCPVCGSDDYDTEPGADGTPDYENGMKRCLECGEEWV